MSAATVLAALLMAAYLLAGALDLGAGLLLPLVARGRDRDAVLASCGQPWSGGAVWTLAGFALVVAGLPESLAALRALWPALVLMSLSLVLRGVLAATRAHVLRRDLVDLGFGLASLLAAACQGLVLGWAVAGLGTGLPARHAGPFGTLSIWGLLCAAGLVGAYGLLGAGWLIAVGRGAVRVFGREVGHAAALLFAGSAILCVLWAAWPTAVLSRGFGHGMGIASAVLVCAALALAALFFRALWGRRPALPVAFAVPAAICAGAAAALLLWPGTPAGSAAEASFVAYLAFVLLLGAPVLALDIGGRVRRVQAAAEDGAGEAHLQAGRRSGALANGLHLS